MTATEHRQQTRYLPAMNLSQEHPVAPFAPCYIAPTYTSDAEGEYDPTSPMYHVVHRIPVVSSILASSLADKSFSCMLAKSTPRV